MDVYTQPIARQDSNALFGGNRLKLGLFGINCDSGCAMTLADDRLHLSWAATKAIAQAADNSGFEALVPVARWLGLGGPTNFNGINFETYSWAAGLAEATKHITLVTTSHVQTVNPIFAAKQAATIDHISGGRYALNIVCGWFQPELEMFGAPFLSHDDRYDYATEWFEIVRRLWTSEERFSFAGKYFKIDDGFSMPKPLQRPLPPTINAGGSAKGKAFIGEFADIAFVLLSNPKDFAKSRATIQSYRDVAASHGRTLQVWTHAYVVQRATQEEADRYLHHIGEEVGNEEAASNAAHYLGLNSQIYTPEEWQRFKLHLKAGYGGFPLVGTAESIAATLHQLADAGIDGVALHWVDYLDGIARFTADILPLLERAGLREPFQPARSSGGVKLASVVA